jgi:membrane protein DedA with SNARE-associated domain
MPWWRFFLFNASGGIVWATGVGLLAYYAGKAAAEAIGRYGLYGVLGLIVLAAIAFFAHRRWRHRAAEET